MRLIEIKALENGAHNNQTINGVGPSTFPVPEGWAVIPEDEKCKNFPFGSFEVEEIDGVPYMKKNSWIPGIMPEPAPEPEAESSVWDELDAAYTAGYDEGYQEGVNTAYDE